jgi:hypothetical protein
MKHPILTSITSMPASTTLRAASKNVSTISLNFEMVSSFGTGKPSFQGIMDSKQRSYQGNHPRSQVHGTAQS